jgi:hypothetical protein
MPVIITATVSVLVCCSIEMIRSLTLPSFLPFHRKDLVAMLTLVEPSRIVALSTNHISTLKYAFMSSRLHHHQRVGKTYVTHSRNFTSTDDGSGIACHERL